MNDTPKTDVMMKFCFGTDQEYIRLVDVIKLERELNAANAKIEQLEEWKQSALSIEREWDVNSITTMLGGKLGESHRKVIQREVPKLLVRIKWLQEAFDAAEGLIAVSNCGCPYGDEVFHCSSCIQAINRYHKAKEAKP